MAVAVSIFLPLPSAQAAPITFTFGCSLDYSTSPDSCSPSGSFGTLTIADSASNPGFAVDLSWNLTPGDPNTTMIGSFFLNFAPATPPQVLSFSLPGPLNFNVNGWPYGGPPQGIEYGFDMRVGLPTGNQPLSGTGTLSATNGISAMDFIALTPGGAPALYASYQVANGNGFYGASSYSVPEPGSLSLAALSLLVLAFGRRRARVTAR
jgi:hypothetical protein